MFNSKSFCVIVVLSAIILGAVVYLQVQEMVQYDLLTKLKNEYFFSSKSSDTVVAPANKDDKK